MDRLKDPRISLPLAALVIVLIGALVLSQGAPRPVTTANASASPTASAFASASATPPVTSASPGASSGASPSAATSPGAAATTAVPTAPPRTATPGPIPKVTPAVLEPRPADSAKLPGPTLAPATPTPTPNPQLWRIEGLVFDSQGPVKDVCIALGPVGCRPYSTRTDDRGVYYLEVPPAGGISYDLHFLKDGYLPFDVRVTPAGPMIFNVSFTRTS